MVDYPDGRKYSPEPKYEQKKIKRSKYNAAKTVLDDIKFDSKKRPGGTYS